MTFAPWDFEYAAIRGGRSVQTEETAVEFIVATRSPINEPTLERALSDCIEDAAVVVIRPPVYWTRVRARVHCSAAELEQRARDAGLPVRYVAATTHESLRAVEPLDFRTAKVAGPAGWCARVTPRGTGAPCVGAPGLWFLGPSGVGIDRERYGLGAGTRLAIIDDDAGGAEALDLDAEVLVDVDALPRSSRHATLLAAWAAGTNGGAGGFAGAAPAASVRLYGIAKPGRTLLSLPLAIMRAADDGADVIVAATYLDGTATPMLDDALEFAVRLGRAGRGCAVVLPTGRQVSSQGGSVHASLTLDLGDPASDPRVFCVGPSGRDGGWFFFRDRHGDLRPFANRGPAVRFLAPGDDVADPFARPERLCHAESSGAASIAAGALLVVLEANPELRLSELSQLLVQTARAVDPTTTPSPAELADPSDALPSGVDADGHNAKHGYGCIDAGRACLAASDPIAAALLEIGELDASRAYVDRLGRDELLRSAYSPDFGRWAARALLAEPLAGEALKALLRHLRLLAGRIEHAEPVVSHAPGAMLHHLAVAMRILAASARVPKAPAEVAREIDRLIVQIVESSRPGPGLADAEKMLVDLASGILSGASTAPRVRSRRPKEAGVWAEGA